MSGDGGASPSYRGNRDFGQKSVLGRVFSGDWNSLFPGLKESDERMRKKQLAKKAADPNAPKIEDPPLPPAAAPAPQVAAAALAPAPTPKQPQYRPASPLMGHGGGSSMADMFGGSQATRVEGPRLSQRKNSAVAAPKRVF